MIVLVGAIEAALIALGSFVGREAVEHVLGVPVDLGATTGLTIVSIVIYGALARAFRLYDLSILIAPDFRRVAGTCVAVILLVTANLFALKAGADISRSFMLMLACMLPAVTCLARIAVAVMLPRMMAENIIAGRRVVLIGDADEVVRLSARDLLRHFGLSEVGRVVVPFGRFDDPAQWAQVVAEAIRTARVSRAEEFILAIPWALRDPLQQIEQGLRASPLPVRLLPDSGVRELAERRGGGPTGSFHLVDLQRAPMTSVEQATKRALDILVAGTTLALLFPLLALVAALIKLDTPGPALFFQRRNGFNQREFLIYKFRTMTVLEDSASVLQATRNDDRITRLGRFLRRTSIDELPQLLNVLRGDMSIVGPRPHALAHDEQYEQLISDYCRRHHVKPGITGWAQVNGLRGETRETDRMRQRVESDIWYISNWSLGLDCRIMLRTAFEVLGHDAY